MKQITKISSAAIFLIFLTGCATNTQLQPIVEDGLQAKIDKEPIIVGVPFSEKVMKTSEHINNQFELLEKIKTQEHVGSFEMVRHNNDLDARKNSSRTLPSAYANQNIVLPGDNSKIVEQKDQEVVEMNKLMERKVAAIDWENNSAHELLKMVSSAVGYSFVEPKNSKDFNINLKLSNVTIAEVINELKKVLSDKKADLVIMSKTKTITIIYK